MAGIYIHIPFCLKKCYYCDFYKTTSSGRKSLFLDALHSEIDLRAGYLCGETADTIYFGGGTPSLLTPDEISTVIGQLSDRISIDPHAEITLEANPEDLHPEYLGRLRETGINRLSIGVQSFSDDDLVKMNRRHTSSRALQSVEDALKAGFENVSIDMIFGLPGLSGRQWRTNIETAVSLPVNHLSAYHLTYHEGTLFYQWLKDGKLQELSENESVEQFEILMEVTSAAGFEQYEISNYARNQAYSRHNSNYWSGKSYLGLGPSAHSYNGLSRQWNISDIGKYLDKIHSGEAACEIEILSEKDKLNDYLITGIRTKWGISPAYLETVYGKKSRDRVEKASREYLLGGQLELREGNIFLTPKGVMVSDQIALALFIY